MMRQRQKQQPAKYPKWDKKESPARLAKARDGNECIDCHILDRTIKENENGPYVLYLHATHCHELDPDLVPPIDGQRLRARCPSCHRRYDIYWQRRAEEVDHQRTLHSILRDQFILKRFLTCQ